MKHDPKLVEIACAVYARAWLETLDPKKAMRAVFDAINSSGIAWVAPWEAPVPAGVTTNWPRDELHAEWAEWRDAHLAESD